MPSTLPPQTELATLFQRLFEPQALLQRARKVEFVQRLRKLHPALFALALTVATLSKERKTYKQIVADMQSVGGQFIQPQSLQERLSLSGAQFLQELVQVPLRHLERRCGPAKEVPDWLAHFSGVWATDVTVMALPATLAPLFPNCGGAPDSAGMKLHLSLDVIEAKLRGFRLTAGNVPEQMTQQVSSHPCGLLHLVDKGYGKNRMLLGQIAQAQQYFITPLWLNHVLYDEHGHRLDVETLCHDNDAAGNLDVFVYLGNPRGKDPQKALKVRLVGIRVPDDVAAQRRRRVRQEARDKGRTVKSRTLRLMAWVLLVTNVPKNKLTRNQVLLAYRLRWQVELMFRRWKHLYGLRAPGYKTEAPLYCHLMAALLAAALMSLIQAVMFRTWDPQQDAEPSPYQVTALFVGQGDLWLLALAGQADPEFRRQLLERLLQGLLLLGRMDKRRKRVSSRRRILEYSRRRRLLT